MTLRSALDTRGNAPLTICDTAAAPSAELLLRAMRQSGLRSPSSALTSPSPRRQARRSSRSRLPERTKGGGTGRPLLRAAAAAAARPPTCRALAFEQHRPRRRQGPCCCNVEKRLSPGRGRRAVAPCSAPARLFGSASSQSSRPALTCIIGARRAWIVPMISSASIPCRYALVVETCECPSWRWITGSGTPSRASSTACAWRS